MGRVNVVLKRLARSNSEHSANAHAAAFIVHNGAQSANKSKSVNERHLNQAPTRARCQRAAQQQPWE